MDDRAHLADFEAFHEVLLHQVNLLLIGPTPNVDALLTRISGLAEAPIPVCALPGPLALPDAGSVLMRDVAAMTHEQQRAFLDWMNAQRRRVHVISATSEPLFTRVRAGLFSPRLYYRLNVVMVYA